MMTEEQADLAHKKLEALYRDLHKLLNFHTEDLNPEQDEYVRTKLGDEFRFWKRRQFASDLPTQLQLKVAAEVSELHTALTTAIGRIEDLILPTDEGQAVKETQRALPGLLAVRDKYQGGSDE